MQNRQKSPRLLTRKVLKKPFLAILLVSFIVFLIILRSLSNRNLTGDYPQLIEKENCNCKSSQSGKVYNFCYVNSQNLSSVGRKFSCDHLEVLEDSNILGNNSFLSNPLGNLKNESEIVFVSSTSNDQFDFTLSSIKCIREFYPDHKCILYGLNLNSSLVDQLPKDPNFEFRQYYNPKPKAVILARVLKELSSFWWIEPEIALRKPNVIKKFMDEISGGHNYSSITSFRSTHQFIAGGLRSEILDFFPVISNEMLKNTSQVEASVLYVTRTESTFNILKWWTLCSLTRNCIQSNQLNVNVDDEYEYKWNFRYDQSVFNLLMMNEFENKNNYFMNGFQSSFVTMKDL